MNKILIIDDSMLNVKILQDILSSDYEVIFAGTGENGLEQARKLLPTLVLLDIVLPGIDGFEVMKQLKQDDLTKAIPVIFITGCNDTEMEERGLILGAVDYITKPFNKHVVCARVKTHVELYNYRKNMEEMALLDGLTGLYNRRAYNDKLAVYWSSAKYSHLNISIVMIDIDFFKYYNDNYGHLAGDKALKLVAMALKSCMTERNCFLARYGGEEFCAVFIDYPTPFVQAIAEKMRQQVATLKIAHEKSKASDVVTISMGGYNTIPKEDDKQELFIKRADEMLYLAKKNGRNMLIWR